MCSTDLPAWDKAAARTLCTKPARTCIMLRFKLHKHPSKGEREGGVLLTCSINHHVKLGGKRVVWEMSHSPSWSALVDGRIRSVTIGFRRLANEEESGDFRCWRCADCSSAASHRCLWARARITEVGGAICWISKNCTSQIISVPSSIFSSRGTITYVFAHGAPHNAFCRMERGELTLSQVHAAAHLKILTKTPENLKVLFILQTMWRY